MQREKNIIRYSITSSRTCTHTYAIQPSSEESALGRNPTCLCLLPLIRFSSVKCYCGNGRRRPLPTPLCISIHVDLVSAASLSAPCIILALHFHLILLSFFSPFSIFFTCFFSPLFILQPRCFSFFFFFFISFKFSLF